MKAFVVGEGFPFDYLILQLCEIFSCLPSQLMQEDSDLIMRLYHLKTTESNYMTFKYESMKR